MKNNKCGVYQILCIPTGKLYVGSSCQIYVRWSQHRNYLTKGISSCRYLQYAWTKHGRSAFRFSILEECDKGQIEEREQFYIDLLKPALNLATSVKRRDSPESRAKIIAAVREKARLRTHCPHGHLYDEANTFIGKKGEKICRACNARRVRQVYVSETAEQRVKTRELARKRQVAYRARQRNLWRVDMFADLENLT